MTLVYLDSSAIVKLAVDEAETPALRDYLRHVSRDGVVGLIANSLALTEVLRAVRRRAPHLQAKVREVFHGIHLIGLSPLMASQAGLVEPETLRSMDAIHVATALEESARLREIVTYDARMVEAARHSGLEVVSPQ